MNCVQEMFVQFIFGKTDVCMYVFNSIFSGFHSQAQMMPRFDCVMKALLSLCHYHFTTKCLKSFPVTDTEEE